MKLADIDPRAVARDALDTLLRHRRRLDARLEPALALDLDGALATLRTTRLEWATLLDASPAAHALALRALGLGRRSTEPPEDPAALVDGSGLGLTLQALVAFGQRGRAWDWTDAEMAAEALLEVTELLWPATDALVFDDVPGALGLALRAVWCRVLLARGSPVAQRWLAELAGVTDGRVRQEITRRALKRVRATKGAQSADRGWITAASAKAWLAARGVAGLGDGVQPTAAEATGEWDDVTRE